MGKVMAGMRKRAVIKEEKRTVIKEEKRTVIKEGKVAEGKEGKVAVGRAVVMERTVVMGRTGAVVMV